MFIKKILLLNGLALLVLTDACSAQNDNNSNNEKNKDYAQVYINSNSNDVEFLKTQNNIASSRQNAITKAVTVCSPAIVGINVTEVKEKTYARNPMVDWIWGEGSSGTYKRKYEIKDLGSGFIISPDGYILTNHHVAGNASKIIVTMTNGEKYDAEIIGADMVSDVCLLKIKGKNFPYLKLGNSDNSIIGEWVIAFGNPFGLFDYNAKPTITVGVISNTGISFFQQNGNSGYSVYKDMIQTDAAISSGNSGGPLVNSLGEVIGMNTMIISTSNSYQGAGSIGLGFSVPINRIKEIIDLLKRDVKIERNSYIGIDVREIDEDIARYYKLTKKDGIFVYQVDNKSPASDVGIETGDVIDKINGRKINRREDYLIAIGDAMVGETLKFDILRGAKSIPYSIKIKKSK